MVEWQENQKCGQRMLKFQARSASEVWICDRLEFHHGTLITEELILTKGQSSFQRWKSNLKTVKTAQMTTQDSELSLKTAEKPWQSFERIQYNSEKSPIITNFYPTASMIVRDLSQEEVSLMWQSSHHFDFRNGHITLSLAFSEQSSCVLLPLECDSLLET